MSCNNTTTVQDASAFYSTYLNNTVTSFERLAERIAHQLGHPMISIDLHQDQVYENISIAVELFTKYAGYKEEYLVFDSSLYVPGRGIKLDELFAITPKLSATYSYNNNLSGGFDYVLNSNRKVRSVNSFDEGTTTGINTLFTIEQSLAQQTYYTYSLGNYGFDLVSWYILKEWLEVREKMLAQKQYFIFDADTQYLQILPEPSSLKYYGVVSCYIDKPLDQLLKEPWIGQYALALCKINLGRIRGKFSGITMFGGGQINWNDVLSEGLAEKKDLEEKVYTGASAGLGSAHPPMFFVG